MYPKNHTQQPGCLIVLLERGIPAGPGCIGAVKPSRWLCTTWVKGFIWQREFDCDLVNLTPLPRELAHDLEQHPERWTRIRPHVSA